MSQKMINKWVMATLCVVILGIIGAMLTKRCGKEGTNLIPMEETMASIEEVRLRGELYVCSALIEDYTIKRATEQSLLWADTEHSCVLTMAQKCSYKIDLDKVEYHPNDSAKTVYVKLPQVTYVATTQSSSFLSDDSNYWAEHLPNTNAMKRQVEEQIKLRFDTADNRRKAERYAEDAISDVLGKLGFEVEFVRTLERPLE